MNFYRIREILHEIEELKSQIDCGSRAWSEGTDPCAMAECDPSDQYCKGEEIDRLVNELKEIVNAM